MTRAELVEQLQVERHLPLPPIPKAGMPHDTAKEQHARRVELMAEVEEFDRYARGGHHLTAVKGAA